MIDPVNGFPYPEACVRLCTDEAARDLARSGFGVLTANGTVLRRGFTTGTTAAAFAVVASLCSAESGLLFLPAAETGMVRCRSFRGISPMMLLRGL